MSLKTLIDVSTMTDFNNSIQQKNIQNNYVVNKGPSGLLEPFQVTWKGLTYRVPAKELFQKKIILNDISGFFKSGQIMAIMGPSGSGKSSLLGCISGQKKTGVSGSITISTAKKVKFAFIAQDDYLLKRLTIRESLMYASKLKNGERVDHEVVVENVIKNLRIQDCADIRPKRCSGGQKKRISIALELVSKPNILILDEPTSGLDTASTWHLITTLIELTKQTEPVAVVATIHQPSAKLFNLFNAVYIMSYDGQCLYHGSPQKTNFYFNAYGLICPQFHNPSDFALEVASKERGIDKEYSNGWYSCYSYYMSKVISDIPFQLTIPCLLSIPAYILTEQYSEDKWRIYFFAIVSILSAFNGSAQGLMVSAWLMKYPTAAVFIGCCMAFPLTLFSGFMISIESMPDFFQHISYISSLRFGMDSSVSGIYGFDRCLETSLLNYTKTDWSRVLPKSAMDKMANSTTINTNTLLSTLRFFSGEVSEETQSIAMIKLSLDDDNLYKGIAMLVILMVLFRYSTYFFVYRKVKALS